MWLSFRGVALSFIKKGVARLHAHLRILGDQICFSTVFTAGMLCERCIWHLNLGPTRSTNRRDQDISRPRTDADHQCEGKSARNQMGRPEKTLNLGLRYNWIAGANIKNGDAWTDDGRVSVWSPLWKMDKRRRVAWHAEWKRHRVMGKRDQQCIMRESLRECAVFAGRIKSSARAAQREWQRQKPAQRDGGGMFRGARCSPRLKEFADQAVGSKPRNSRGYLIKARTGERGSVVRAGRLGDVVASVSTGEQQIRRGVRDVGADGVLRGVHSEPDQWGSRRERGWATAVFRRFVSRQVARACPSGKGGAPKRTLT